MQVSRERYFMTARTFICSRCAAYRVSCDAKKECAKVAHWIDERMEEELQRHEAEIKYQLAGLAEIEKRIKHDERIAKVKDELCRNCRRVCPGIVECSKAQGYITRLKEKEK